VLLFFDEIQKIEDWSSQIKVAYDLYPNIKIFISGSESLLIKTSKESLAGRMFEFKLRPLSFCEYLDFVGFHCESERLELYREDLRGLFESYMRSGGFPEMVMIDDCEIVKKYIMETIVERIVYKDIPALFSIEDPSILETILKLLIAEPGQIINLNELAGELGISRQTLSTYLNYLECSYLTRKLYNFSTNKRKTERKLKRYYSEIFSTAFSPDDLLYRSRVFENTVISCLEGEFFFRDAYKHEIDLVIPSPEIVPVEVKYGRYNVKSMDFFLNRHKLKKGVIISSDIKDNIMKREYEIQILPAYEYFL
jgi:predicted AAA+ superfamily ATPase